MCLSPVTIKRSIAGKDYLNNVPCNHCLECVKDHQNEYIVRTIEEQKKRGTMCFFTLTYSPAALPMTEDMDIDEETGEVLEYTTQTLRRADVSLWLHTFRKRMKRLGLPCDFGHLICGEYGPKTQRPHYHGLILGLSKEDVDMLMKYWSDKHGFVCYKFVPSLLKDIQAVARYTAKYVCKNEDWNVVPKGAEKPRKMTSQFYGYPEPQRAKVLRDYYTAQDIVSYDISNPVFEDVAQMKSVIREIIKRRKYNLGNGYFVKLPNYYKRHFFYEKVAGKVRSSALQRMVTYNVQCDFDKDFKEELHNLASLYDLGDYSQVVDRYNAVHDADKLYRAQRYAESDDRYMRKSVF